MEMVIEKIQDTDLILIGIGEEFLEKGSAFESEKQRYIFDEGIRELKHCDFYLEVLKKKWIQSNQSSKVLNAYNYLAQLCEGKNYYILSTCYDDIIYDSKLNKDRIVTPCGGRRRIQVDSDDGREILSEELTLEIEDRISRAFNEQKYTLLKNIDLEYQECILSYNSILSDNYNENGYIDNWNKYLKWLQGTINKKLCVLELGVGLQFPSVIRWPFEKVVFYNQKSCFFRVHEHLYQMTAELNERGKSIMMNSIDFLESLEV